jgi:hypothetical protein
MMSRRLSPPPATGIALFIILIFAASCSSRSAEPRLPQVENLMLRLAFKEGLIRSYRLKVTLESPAGGSLASGRNLSISWDQKVAALKGSGASLIESRISDVVFETEDENPSKGELSAAIQKALRGATYSFEVSSMGEVSGAGGDETDWDQAFGPYFEKNGVPPDRRSFIVQMASLNFSRDQILSIVTLPFMSLPEGPVEEPAG